MDKWLIDRRVDQMQAEGVIFCSRGEIGVDVTIGSLVEDSTLWR